MYVFHRFIYCFCLVYTGKNNVSPLLHRRKRKEHRPHLSFLICTIYLFHKTDLSAQDVIIYQLIHMRKQTYQCYKIYKNINDAYH
jgi:hypothetical protein